MLADRLHLGQRSRQRPLARLGNLVVQRLLQRGDFVRGQNPLAQQPHLHFGQRFAQGVGFALGSHAVVLVVVRQRVGVRAHHMPMHKRRPQAGAAMRHGALKSPQTGFWIGAVHLGEVKVGEVGHQPGNVAARRIHLDRHADGVAVVFHAEDDRQLLV